MSNYVDTKALRARLSDYRRALIERDAASACKREGDLLEASHRAADAAKAVMNATPALLDAADERDKLSADWDDAHAALSEVCSTTDKDHDLPLHLSEMAETVVGWLKDAQSERDALRAECERLRDALSDAVRSVGGARRGCCGDHYVYSPQISEATLDIWRAAIAAQEPR